MLLLALTFSMLAGGVGTLLWRRQRIRRRHEGLVQRMAHRFPKTLSAVLDDAYVLRSPPGPSGRVSVRDEGLLVRLDQDAASAARLIPWGEIHHVDLTGRGVFRVHISAVGDLAVPMAAGRKIWDGTLAARSASRQPVAA